MKSSRFLWCMCLGVLACSGRDGQRKTPAQAAPLPGQNAADLKQPLAHIDDATITVGEFQQRLNEQSPYIRARYTSGERKKEFLENLIKFEVLAKEAQGKGYDRDAEVLRVMKQEMIRKLMKDEFESRVKPDDISEADCKKYYDAHSSEFSKPDEVRVSAIMVKDKKKADEAAKALASKAKSAPGRADKAVDQAAFRELVQQYSEDGATRDMGGDLSYTTADSPRLPKEIVTAAFALKDIGSFTPEPVKTKEGYYLLLMSGRNRAFHRNFDEVKQQIRGRLYREKRAQAMDDYITGLKQKAHVQIDEGALGKVMVDVQGSPPGSMGAPPMGTPPPRPGSMGAPPPMGGPPRPPATGAR